MFRKTLLAAIAIVGLSTSGFANDLKTVAIVNFSDCMSDSKLGQQEQASFESLKTQMASLLEDTEKQINEIASKFNDPEFLDGLSPEAEEEMRIKYQQLSEEMNRYQNQYYQVLQQANMKIVQSLGANIQEASEKVAKAKKLAMVINKEACFFFTPTLDVTDDVIAEMDKIFDSTQTASNQPVENKTASAKR